jgi:hypothetical protein
MQRCAQGAAVQRRSAICKHGGADRRISTWQRCICCPDTQHVPGLQNREMLSLTPGRLRPRGMQDSMLQRTCANTSCEDAIAIGWHSTNDARATIAAVRAWCMHEPAIRVDTSLFVVTHSGRLRLGRSQLCERPCWGDALWTSTACYYCLHAITHSAKQHDWLSGAHAASLTTHIPATDTVCAALYSGQRSEYSQRLRRTCSGGACVLRAQPLSALSASAATACDNESAWVEQSQASSHKGLHAKVTVQRGE